MPTRHYSAQYTNRKLTGSWPRLNPVDQECAAFTAVSFLWASPTGIIVPKPQQQDLY